MPVPTVKQLPYNWSTDRKGAPVVAIVAHNTVGRDSRAYLSRGGEAPDGSDRKVSIHSLIQRDGILYRYVPDERGANHAGFGTMPQGFPQVNPNLCTMSFELENASDGRALVEQYTHEQLLTMGWEINRIRAKFGPIPILRHALLDPGRRLDTVGLSVEEMEQWANAAAVTTDPWRAWGERYPLPADQHSFGLPQLWLENHWLGEARSADFYPPDAPGFVCRVFQGGLIWCLGGTCQLARFGKALP